LTMNKNIILSYDSTGHFAEKYEEDKYYIAQGENNVLVFTVTFPDDISGSVRAYIGFKGGGNVVDCGVIGSASSKIEYVLPAEYLAHDYLKIGFEVVTPTKEIRFEPAELYVDEFVNVSGKQKASGYTVTVKVGTVTTLPAGSEATVKNVGTDKDAILVFGIPQGPQGDKGDKGDKGDTGPMPELAVIDYSNIDDCTTTGFYKITKDGSLNFGYLLVVSVTPAHYQILFGILNGSAISVREYRTSWSEWNEILLADLSNISPSPVNDSLMLRSSDGSGANFALRINDEGIITVSRVITGGGVIQGSTYFG